MTMVGAASLVAIAVLLAIPARPRRLTPKQRVADDRSGVQRVRPLLVAAVAVGCWAILGGLFGAIAGIAAGVGAWRLAAAGESPASRARRRDLEDQLPLAVHLLGACLAAGAAVPAALETVADAMAGPVADELCKVAVRLHLGADPAEAWARALGQGPLEPLAWSFVRAHRSGASVVAAVDALSDDLRRSARARVEARARTVEVRATAPLGACLLPAFLLLGVIPMAVGAFSPLDVFG